MSAVQGRAPEGAKDEDEEFCANKRESGCHAGLAGPVLVAAQE